MALPTGTAAINSYAQAGVPVGTVNGQTLWAPLAVAANIDGSAAGASGTTPVTGTFGAIGTSALFTAIPGNAIWVKLSGTFVATVQVERCSTGLAASAQVLTVAGSVYAVFTAPAQEVVSAEDDAGAAYRLNCTAYTSGTVTYSIGHK